MTSTGVRSDGLPAVSDLRPAWCKKRQQMYMKKMVVNSKGCWTGKKARRDKYVRTTLTKGVAAQRLALRDGVLATGKERSYYLHHVSWYAEGHRLPLPRKEHLSHLCHNQGCFNPNHLCLESPQANMPRKGCVGHVDCPNCSTRINVCTHDPPCIM